MQICEAEEVVVDGAFIANEFLLRGQLQEAQNTVRRVIVSTEPVSRLAEKFNEQVLKLYELHRMAEMLPELQPLVAALSETMQPMAVEFNNYFAKYHLFQEVAVEVLRQIKSRR